MNNIRVRLYLFVIHADCHDNDVFKQISERIGLMSDDDVSIITESKVICATPEELIEEMVPMLSNGPWEVPNYERSELWTLLYVEKWLTKREIGIMSVRPTSILPG